MKHSTRQPNETEAVKWISKHAECSLGDALKILNSAIENNAIVCCGKTYEGSWKSLLDKHVDKWCGAVKRIKVATNVYISDALEEIPDGCYTYIVDSAERVNCRSGYYLKITIRVEYKGQFHYGSLEVMDDDDEQRFMKSVGRETDKEFSLDADDVVGLMGWVEKSDSNTPNPHIAFCPPKSDHCTTDGITSDTADGTIQSTCEHHNTDTTKLYKYNRAGSPNPAVLVDTALLKPPLCAQVGVKKVGANTLLAWMLQNQSEPEKSNRTSEKCVMEDELQDELQDEFQDEFQDEDPELLGMP